MSPPFFFLFYSVSPLGMSLYISVPQPTRLMVLECPSRFEFNEILFPLVCCLECSVVYFSNLYHLRLTNASQSASPFTGLGRGWDMCPAHVARFPLLMSSLGIVVSAHKASCCSSLPSSFIGSLLKKAGVSIGIKMSPMPLPAATSPRGFMQCNP